MLSVMAVYIIYILHKSIDKINSKENKFEILLYSK